MRPEIFRRIRYRPLDEQAILRVVTASLGLGVLDGLNDAA